MEPTKTRRETYAQGWKLYFFSALGHHLQGAGAAVAILGGQTPVLVAALVWSALYVAYQGLSVMRKDDSPGLDIADYIAGFGAGCVGFTAWSLLA